MTVTAFTRAHTADSSLLGRHPIRKTFSDRPASFSPSTCPALEADGFGRGETRGTWAGDRGSVQLHPQPLAPQEAGSGGWQLLRELGWKEGPQAGEGPLFKTLKTGLRLSRVRPAR